MRYLILCLTTLLIAVSPSAQQVTKRFELKALEGSWVGTGEMEIPNFGTSVSVSGSADFAFDSRSRSLALAIDSDMLLFPFSDTGRAFYHGKRDSIRIDMNAYGKKYRHFARIERDGLRSTSFGWGYRFDTTIRLVSPDSVDVVVMATGADSVTTRQAHVGLHRVESSAE